MGVAKDRRGQLHTQLLEILYSFHDHFNALICKTNLDSVNFRIKSCIQTCKRVVNYVQIYTR